MVKREINLVILQANIFSLQKFSESRRQFDGASNLRQTFAQAIKLIMVAIKARVMRTRRANLGSAVKQCECTSYADGST
jgi:hypothetical protein